MRPKKTIEKMLTGLLVALMVAILLPSAALAAPAASSVQMTDRSEAVLAFSALEIIPQESHVVTPRSTGIITSDATTFDAGLPAQTTVLFVIGGVVNEIDAANGQWKIGNQPVYVYEGAGTTITGTPALGDTVRVVGKRTLAPGPIVAQFITMINRAPQIAGPAVVTTALLLNGTATTVGAASWTVTPPAAAAVNFSILADTSPLGPTVITPGLVSGSAVTVEYVSSAAPVAPPTADIQANWRTLSTPVKLGAASDTWAEFVTSNNLNFEMAYRWDAALQAFQAVEATYEFKPLEAVYVKMNAGATVQFVPSDQVSAPPSKALVAGWNFVGAAFLDVEKPVNQALMTAYFATGGNQWGYAQVISPAVNQASWAYVRDAAPVPNMRKGEGYWVYVQNPAQLAGFTTTPLQ